MFLKFIGLTSATLDIALNYDVTESTFIKGRRQVYTAILEHILPLTIKWPTMQNMREMFNAVDVNGHLKFPNATVFLWESHSHLDTVVASSRK